MADSQSFSSISTSKPPILESLSSAQSPDLKLEPATLLEYVQTAYLNAEEWRGPLTLDQYLQREDILQATDLTRGGRITGWILTSESMPRNPDGSRPIFASCESIPIHAYIARDGALEHIQAHGIASVYNRVEHRGKGYASRMMADLGKKLETWQSADDAANQFSVLFSDIGQIFYARFGWKVFPSTHIHLEATEQSVYSSTKPAFPAVEDLSLEELKHLPTIDYFEQRLRDTSKANPERTVVAIRPDLEHFGWHFARDEFQTRIMGNGFPKVKGALHRATGLGLIWCRVYAAKKSEWQLHILHTIIPPVVENSADAQDAMAALLLRAQSEAHDWEMSAGIEVSFLLCPEYIVFALVDYHLPLLRHSLMIFCRYGTLLNW